MSPADDAHRRPPVIAIGLDAAEPRLLDRWIREGHLPNLARLKSEGCWGDIHTAPTHVTESVWGSFISGVAPNRSGLWGAYRFCPETYATSFVEAGTPDAYPPFYALGPDRRVAAFDVPKSRVHDDVHGMQIVAWGATVPDTEYASRPENLLSRLLESYGPYPGPRAEVGEWWDSATLKSLPQALAAGARLRTRIVRDLIQREPWDLFLTVFGEPHTAGHAFWHLSQPDHPLFGRVPNPVGQGDPLLQAYRDVDTALGSIFDAAPADSIRMVFTIHGMDSNVDDLPSGFFLGEVLYRLCFPGRRMFPAGEPGTPVPPPVVRPRRKNWTSAIWAEREDSVPWRRWLRRHLPNRFEDHVNRLLGTDHAPGLASPSALQKQGDPTFWQPVSWYQRLWPEMKAFALPSFTGQVRINLKGRDASGIVPLSEYRETCDWVERELRALVNARTGRPLVREIVRTRERGDETDATLGDGDLVIEWSDEPADTVESPSIGRIGPVPFKRPGSHQPHGSYFVAGPGIDPGQGPSAELLDLPPTILSLVGAPIPPRLSGRPIPLGLD